MAFEEEILSAAICDANDEVRTLAERAESAVAGGIYYDALFCAGAMSSDHVQAGLDYLDNIHNRVAVAVEDNSADTELVEAIEKYAEYADQVDRNVYIELLKWDWVETHCGMGAEQIARITKLLIKLQTLLQNTSHKRGHFLLPLLDRDEGRFLWLQLVVVRRLSEIQKPQIMRDPVLVELLSVGLHQLFEQFIECIKRGDAFPPEDAEVQEALLGLLTHAFD